MNNNNDDEENEEYNIIDILMNFKKAENIVYTFLIIIDYFLTFICFIIFKSENKNIKYLKYKLYSLFLLDSFLLLIIKAVDKNNLSITNELFISLLYTCQFLSIISFFENIVINLISGYDGTKIDPYRECLIFLIIIFSYDRLFSPAPIYIYILEYLFIFKYIFKLFNYLWNVFIEIDNNLENYRFYSNINLKDIPIYYIIIYFAYFCLKIIDLFIGDENIKIYYIIFIFVIEIFTKYSFFSILIFILSKFNKISTEGKNNKNALKKDVYFLYY